MRRERIPRRALAIAGHQGIAEIIERRARADQSRLEGRQRLGSVHQQLLVVATGPVAEGFFVAARKHGIAAQQFGSSRRSAAHLARVDQRADALGPERVACSIPAEPVEVANVPQRRCPAIELDRSACLGEPVAPLAARLVAGGAAHAPVARQARFVEQMLAQHDAGWHAGHIVRRIAHRRGRPGAMLPDRADLLGRPVEQLLRANAAGRCREQPREQQQQPDHLRMMSCVRRSLSSPARTSKVISQRPGIWNNMPSALKRPSPFATMLAR